MMDDRSVIEFWSTRVVGDQVSLVMALVTDASPPPVGAFVNIRGEDHQVLAVDYSIDQPTGGPRTYRRNVIMRLKDAA
jgi:hypothetical protein